MKEGFSCLLVLVLLPLIIIFLGNLLSKVW